MKGVLAGTVAYLMVGAAVTLSSTIKAMREETPKVSNPTGRFLVLWVMLTVLWPVIVYVALDRRRPC